MDDVGLWILVVFGGPLWIALVVMAFVALSRSHDARKKAEEVEENAKGAVQRLWGEVLALQGKVARLEAELATARLAAPSVGAALASSEMEAPSGLESPPSDGRKAPSALESPPSDGRKAPSALESPPSDGREAPSALESAPSDGREAPSALESAPSLTEISPSTSHTAPSAPSEAPPRPPGAPTPLPATSPGRPPTLEERIGLVWFTRVGALVLLLGVAYFFKYAVDSEWIGPTGRVAIGASAGLAALVFAEVTRTKTRRVFTHAALGIGLSLLYVSAYASHAFYDIAPTSAAFGAFFVISVLGGALAVRHRGEAILVFSTVAALATPAVLSTGEDRPLALFGYALVVTALVYVAAIRMVFRVAPWVAVVGSLALFLGWYVKFFDTTAQLSMVHVGGGYAEVSARVVPAAFVALSAATWVLLDRVATARKLPSFGGAAYVVIASLFLHVGATMLFYDHPIGLGLGLTALSALSVGLLWGAERSGLLVLPLLASFVALVATSHRATKADTTSMMLALSAWALVYLAAIVVPLRARPKDRRGGALALLGMTGLFLAVLATEVLFDDEPRTLTYFLVGISAVFAALAALLHAPSLSLGAATLSIGFLLLSMHDAGDHDPTSIAIAACWAAIFAAHAAYELLVRKEPPTNARLILPSAAALGFVVLSMTHTTSADGNLRAGLLFGAGAMLAALGVPLLLRGDARGAATLLLGQALAAIAAGLAFLVSGASITVAWVALATVVMVLGAREKDRVWIAGATVLFLFALGRVLLLDVEAPGKARDIYVSSFGIAGAMWPRPFVNERSLALLGTAIGLFVSARVLARTKDDGLTPLGFVALILAHGLTLTLVILESKQLLVSHLDVAPSPTSRMAFQSALAAFEQGEASHAMDRAMITTMALGLYAAALVGIGFGGRSAAHRYLGLTLFAVTLAKLGLWDVWNLPRILQIGVLVLVGALLLGASFLYARFGKRLVTLLREGGEAKPPTTP